MTDVQQSTLDFDAGGAPDFGARLDEPVEQLLDLSTWASGPDMAAVYTRLDVDSRIAAGIEAEDELYTHLRQRILPMLRSRLNAPPNAGVYSVRPDQIKRAHQELLFNGLVQVSDGTMSVHRAPMLSLAQIGVCLASYQGSAGTWSQQLFRRDVRIGMGDMLEQVVAVLENRQQRAFDELQNGETWETHIARKFMAYAERAVLLRAGRHNWLMGHGNPTPYELLTGTSNVNIMDASIKLLRELVLEHRKFVFVPSKVTDIVLDTIGHALHPLQFAIVDTAEQHLTDMVSRANYTGSGPMPRGEAKLVRDFIGDAGSKIVRGVYRASAHAPAHVFYAHADHALQAGLIALADSTLQTDRGFPLLIDLADRVCRATFDPGSFNTLVQQAYTRAGQPLRYLSERETRKG